VRARALSKAYNARNTRGFGQMRSPSGEGERGSVIDFALIIILFSIVLITIAVLLGPSITDFFGRLVVAR